MCSRRACRACSRQPGLLRGGGRCACGKARWGAGSRRRRWLHLLHLRQLHAADHRARRCSIDRVVGEDAQESVEERCTVQSFVRRRVASCGGIPPAAGQTSCRRRILAALAAVASSVPAWVSAEVRTLPLLLPHGTCGGREWVYECAAMSAACRRAMRMPPPSGARAYLARCHSAARRWQPQHRKRVPSSMKSRDHGYSEAIYIGPASPKKVEEDKTQLGPIS